MFAVEHAAHSDVATTNDDADRGAEIRRRYEKLGISDREWTKQTGIARQTLHRAFTNAPGTRESTYLAIETALSKLEDFIAGKAMPPGVTPIGDPADKLFSIELDGLYGAQRVVVKGPIENADLIREQVTKLLAGRDRDTKSRDDETP